MEAIKRKMRVFRKKELEELLMFLHLDPKGIKATLQNRALSYIHGNCLDGPARDELEEKIKELVLSSKVPLRKKYVAPQLPADTNPMFVELAPIIHGQQFDLKHGEQVLNFSLTPVMINSIEKGWQEDGSNTHEIALILWNFLSIEEWDAVEFQVLVNNRRLHVKHPGSQIVHLTTYCDMSFEENLTVLKICADSIALQNFAYRVSFVKNNSPECLVLDRFPKHNELNSTKYLVNKYCEANSIRILTINMICPKTNSIMKYPCRTIHCQHPDVFDLVPFLREAQYFVQWKCPVCRVLFKYDDIRIDDYLRTYASHGKTLFRFYKSYSQNSNNFIKDTDLEIETEIITLD